MVIYLDFLINQDYYAKSICIEKDEVDNTCMANCVLQNDIEQNDLPQLPKLLSFHDIESFLHKTMISYSIELFEKKIEYIAHYKLQELYSSYVPDKPPPEFIF